MGNVDWGFAGAVVITGLAVVFAILLLLVFLCWLISLIFKLVKGENKKNTKRPTNSEMPKEKLAPVPSAKQALPVVEEGIMDEVVAAISAAVAVMMGPKKGFALRSVKRAGGRNEWNAAGIMENTRSF